MTLDAAHASFTELSLGSIIPGKFADLVILSRDIMTVDAGDILGAKVVATIVDGALIYGKV